MTCILILSCLLWKDSVRYSGSGHRWHLMSSSLSLSTEATFDTAAKVEMNGWMDNWKKCSWHEKRVRLSATIPVKENILRGVLREGGEREERGRREGGEREERGRREGGERERERERERDRERGRRRQKAFIVKIMKLSITRRVFVCASGLVSGWEIVAKVRLNKSWN